MVTIEQVRTIMPALTAARGAELFPFLTAAMTEFAIDAPARIAAFLSQLAHESAQFRFMEELWGPTAAQTRYEWAADRHEGDVLLEVLLGQLAGIAAGAGGVAPGGDWCYR